MAFAISAWSLQLNMTALSRSGSLLACASQSCNLQAASQQHMRQQHSHLCHMCTRSPANNRNQSHTTCVGAWVRQHTIHHDCTKRCGTCPGRLINKPHKVADLLDGETRSHTGTACLAMLTLCQYDTVQKDATSMRLHSLAALPPHGRQMTSGREAYTASTLSP